MPCHYLINSSTRLIRTYHLELPLSDARKHRGPHPEDEVLFANNQIPALQTSTSHLSWLLSRGYALPSSLKLVGDRFRLKERQRTAVKRATCSDEQRHKRDEAELAGNSISGQAILVDGFNLITTIEACLSGGVLIHCQDGCVRDMASMHGSYRKVSETEPALKLIGKHFAMRNVNSVHWLLDQPVSNSGRLRQLIEDIASKHQWPWTAELVPDPDVILKETTALVVTADSGILDECVQWWNAAGEIIAEAAPAWVIELSA